MRPSALNSSVRRHADDRLYDRGRDLVEAATAIRRIAGSPDAVRAVPALLGCVEAALRELNTACATLGVAVAGPVGAGRPLDADPSASRRIDRVHRGFTNLYSALEDAEAASAAARTLVARTLAAATGDGRDLASG
jgi:hypothetical protein